MIDTDNDILKALLAGDHKQCSLLTNQLFESGNDIITIYEEYLKPALYKVGEMWEENEISVATEHLASAIVESLLNELSLKFSIDEPTNKTVIVTCLENEHHQIGARMVSDIFELQGWKVLFLGANTPKRDLINFIIMTKPHLVAISTSIYFHLPTLEETLDLIRKDFPELLIVIGGQAFVRGGVDIVKKYDKLVYLSSLDRIKHFI